VTLVLDGPIARMVTLSQKKTHDSRRSLILGESAERACAVITNATVRVFVRKG
jgi:hypothetical protein